VGGDDRVFDAGGAQCRTVPARPLEGKARLAIIEAMRFLTAVLALVFSLAMAGPETHACPIHSSVPGAPGAPGAPVSHHQDQNSHQKAGHCTCPQACCPPGVGAALPTRPAAWVARPPAVRVADAVHSTSVLLPVRKHLLPFALAPPLALA